MIKHFLRPRQTAYRSGCRQGLQQWLEEQQSRLWRLALEHGLVEVDSCGEGDQEDSCSGEADTRDNRVAHIVGVTLGVVVFEILVVGILMCKKKNGYRYVTAE